MMYQVLWGKSEPNATKFKHQKQKTGRKILDPTKERTIKRVFLEYSLRADDYAASIFITKTKPQKISIDAVPPISFVNK